MHLAQATQFGHGPDTDPGSLTPNPSLGLLGFRLAGAAVCLGLRARDPGVGDLQQHSHIGSPTHLDFTYSCSAHFRVPGTRDSDSISTGSTHSSSRVGVELQAGCLWPNQG